VEAVRRQCSAEQEEALEELREESEKLLASIEGAMNKLREERDLTEEEAAELREQLEAQEELALKLRKDIEGLRKAGVLQGLRMIVLMSVHLKRYNAMVLRKDEERAVALQQLQEEWEQRYDMLVQELEAEREKVGAFLLMQSTLVQTLTHHKREMLLEHKMKSSVIQSDLADVYDRKQSLQEKHETLTKAMGNMEGQIRQLETEMQELTKQSVIVDGKVNVALQRKKKRVDRDLDAMIIKVSEQRDKIGHVTIQLEDTETARLEKEEELKFVEAQLVNTLLEQQRRLVEVLNTVTIDPEEYGVAGVHQDAQQFDAMLHDPSTEEEKQNAAWEKGSYEDQNEVDDALSDASSDDGYIVGRMPAEME
jgi:myosin heavy subunit